MIAQTRTVHATARQAQRVRAAIAAAGFGDSRELDWDDGRRLISLESADAVDVVRAPHLVLPLPAGVWLEPVNLGVISVLREVPLR
jgi:hypothetical protein